MSDEIPAFLRRAQLQRDRDKLDDLIEAARSRSPEERFQLRKRELDRIEIRTVRREELQPRAAPLDRRAHLRLFVRREIIEHDHIARMERRRKDLFDIRQERRVIDRSIKDGRRRQAVEPQSDDDGVCLPVTARRVIAQPRAARAASIAAQQIRRDPALVEEQILAHVPQRLDARPGPTRRSDIRPALFVGVYGFF